MPTDYTLADVLVTANEQTQTLAAWQNTDTVGATTAVTTLDGATSFQFDDPTGKPQDVIVYTNGR